MLTMFDEGGERSRSHGLHRDVLLAQAASMGLPLRQQDRRSILKRVWAAGIRCQIIAVDESRLSGDVLGSELTPALATVIESRGIDACGENGEFHTVVVDAPMFDHAIELQFGEIVSRGGYLAIDARLCNSPSI
ncbi:MAG: diphthine-ammonia ligase [Planctomycetota bacterium]|jgi:diphthine-ammonia ligase